MPVKLVVALVGLPGSGKSTLAASLSGRLGLALIDRDRIRDRLFPDCRFTAAEKQAANQAVLQTLRENCAAGTASLLDGMTFGRESERRAVRRVAVEHGFECAMLWLDCPVDVAAERVARQAHAAGDRTPQLVRDVAERFERPADAVRLDATLSAERLLECAVAALA
ncbi:MAG TPA: ATP-binding protein [Gammaproteobacteria bacterium]|nr:ATP-binding protein [Gammaproteobacteria bacterium]